MKLTTGIPKMDELLDGGLPSGGFVLILSDPMVDKSTFAQQILSKRIDEEDNPIYLTTNNPPKAVLRNMEEHGWDEDTITWVDCISKTMGEEPRSEFYLDMMVTEGRKSFEGASESWTEAIEKVKEPKTAVWDNLETFMEVPEDILEEKLADMKENLKDTNSLGVFLLTDWGYEKNRLAMLKDLADLTVTLDVLERKTKWINYYRVDGSPRIFFRITFSGVNLYVPKILITGPFNSGKSSMVRQLSERSVSVDRVGTTVSLDHGHIESKGLVTDLFGTPGQEKFDWILKILSKDIWGLILIIDSADPDFPRAKKMMEGVKERDIPFVVFANKQDLDEALSPEEIKESLGYPTVVGTSALTGENCEKGLKTLFDKIFSSRGK